jgi:hypothetical protein
MKVLLVGRHAQQHERRCGAERAAATCKREKRAQHAEPICVRRSTVTGSIPFLHPTIQQVTERFTAKWHPAAPTVPINAAAPAAIADAVAAVAAAYRHRRCAKRSCSDTGSTLQTLRTANSLLPSGMHYLDRRRPNTCVSQVRCYGFENPVEYCVLQCSVDVYTHTGSTAQ